MNAICQAMQRSDSGKFISTFSQPLVFRIFKHWFGGRWLAKLVARLLATATLRVNPDISQKYKMGDISKGVANTL
jgi:hypothetical protein